MSHEQDLTVVTEAAWTAFRGRVADHVAAMADDEVLVVEHRDAVASDDETAPYVQVIAYGEGWVRVEAAGNAYLDETVALDDEQESLLLALGWSEPTGDEGLDNFHLHAEQRDADRVAVLLVQTLREVYGVPHPAFLGADGLEVAPGTTWEPADRVEPDDTAEPTSPDTVAFVHGPDHLQELVDEAMTEVFPDLKHDDDGDIPIRAGRSVAYVRVVPERPAVEVTAEIVLDVVDLDRLALEVNLLNRAHPLWKFIVTDDAVVMRHELVAVPFSAHLLRYVAHRFVDEVDAIAGDLVERVGGRRFRDRAPDDTEIDDVDLEADDLAVVGLLELCHLGRPRASTVAGLFDHDRSEIIRQIVRIRTGRQDCDGHDVDDVLTALRKALRLVSDGEQRPEPLPPKPRSVQSALDVDTGDDTLDIGWPA